MKPLLVRICEEVEAKIGHSNRITKKVLHEWNENEFDISKLILMNAQTKALFAAGHSVAEDCFDSQLGDTQYVSELREGFKDALKEAGPFTSNMPAFRFFTGPIPAPYAQLLPPEGYEGPQWKPIVRIRSLENFKYHSLLKMGDLGRFGEVAEGQQYGGTSRGGRWLFYRPTKYGLEVGMTWEMVINDDMDAFNNLMQELVLSGVDSLNAYVWGLIEGNPTLWDGDPLFHANHNNLGAVALDTAALGDARAAMKRHTSDGGKPINNIVPKYLIVPPELEQDALIILNSSAIPTADMSSGVFNPEQGQLTLLVTAYLAGEDGWYLWAPPATSPVMELGFLFGNDTPEISQKEIWETEEIRYRGKLVYGHAFCGFMGAYYSVPGV
jgi:hypothetical protein